MSATRRCTSGRLPRTDPTLVDIARVLAAGFLRLTEKARSPAVFHNLDIQKRLDAGAHRRHCHDVERAPRRRACKAV